MESVSCGLTTKTLFNIINLDRSLWNNWSRRCWMSWRLGKENDSTSQHNPAAKRKFLFKSGRIMFNDSFIFFLKEDWYVSVGHVFISFNIGPQNQSSFPRKWSQSRRFHNKKNRNLLWDYSISWAKRLLSSFLKRRRLGLWPMCRPGLLLPAAGSFFFYIAAGIILSHRS